MLPFGYGLVSDRNEECISFILMRPLRYKANRHIAMLMGYGSVSNKQQPYNMNADQTYNSVVFTKSFDEKDQAKRQSIARGVSLPDIWTIRSQDYVNSTTQKSGRRYTSRFEGRYLDSANALQIGEIYVVMAVPGTFPSAAWTTMLATFRAYVATAGTLEAVCNDEK